MTNHVINYLSFYWHRRNMLKLIQKRKYVTLAHSLAMLLVVSGFAGLPPMMVIWLLFNIMAIIVGFGLALWLTLVVIDMVEDEEFWKQ